MHKQRIACLLPSATDICISLGLAPFIVGVTHECDVDAVREACRISPDNASNTAQEIYILTGDGLTVSSQRSIHDAILKQQEEQGASNMSCSTTQISSLYPVLVSEWKKAQPTIVITQDLCAVCAPSKTEIERIIKDDATNQNVRMISLQPGSLLEVADSFVAVASTCGVLDRGLALKNKFLEEVEQIRSTIRACQQEKDLEAPSVLLLEWLDPPFDGGHWILQMMDYACVRPAVAKTSVKSQEISWESVSKADPDCLLVACCGFDLSRNLQDANEARDRFLPLRAAGNLFACNGDQYFARPGPSILMGTIILAYCAYQNEPDVLHALQKLSFVPPVVPGWAQVKFQTCDIPDIEDAVPANDFMAVHKVASDAGEMTYLDPETGYAVFTEVAHKKRGNCCGSGCRHCPFSHINVKDKVNRIQQPAFLYESDADLFSVRKHSNVKVLFFSGGKDSFLTIRALVKQYAKAPFGLVLLTTFDSKSRMILHQEVSLEIVLRQAQHLDISLLGVPNHRGSTETYVNRIHKGLDVIESSLGGTNSLSILAFGDLHLDNIRSWRDKNLGRLGYELEYPLWKVAYSDLMTDLEESQVACVVSAVTREGVSVGDVFGKEYSERIAGCGIDAFGENGEFHTCARVWEVDRERALGSEINLE